MLSDSFRTRVWDIANPYYLKEDWAHGRNHIERVVKAAVKIGKEEGADLEVIELAAILHDIFQYKEMHSNIDGFRHEVEGANEAKAPFTFYSANFGMISLQSFLPQARRCVLN